MPLECPQTAPKTLPERPQNAPRTPPDRPQNAPSTYPDALAMRSQCAYNALAMRSQCVAWRRSRPVVHKKTLRPPWKSSAVFRPLPIGRRPRLHPSRLFFELTLASNESDPRPEIEVLPADFTRRQAVFYPFGRAVLSAQIAGVSGAPIFFCCSKWCPPQRQLGNFFILGHRKPSDPRPEIEVFCVLTRYVHGRKSWKWDHIPPRVAQTFVQCKSRRHEAFL